MLNILKSVFGSNKIHKAKNQNNGSSAVPIEKYFVSELQNTDLVKPEKRQIVLQHLTHKINLNKSGNKLSSEEKKALGLNSRLSITHDLIDVLTAKGLNEADPKSVLSSIFYKATFSKSHDDQLEKYLEIGVKEFKVLSVKDERECTWCKSVNNKSFPVTVDINKLINENCTCSSHCRICTTAVI